ncbi:MAG: hypothetical protein CO189_12020 [candidate division Zixibacteria bacterium CG_4_9_14_3_um_filter_46_8]|nr:MAG: hypothetical protein CO189_12020 [candidate division Zixibacteria bacterium CG_4_9_14_3_um_filter_46_8]
MKGKSIFLLIVIFLISTHAMGQNLLWQNSYGGSFIDQSFGLCETYDGGYVMTGFTLSFSNNPGVESDLWLVKTDSNGNVVWSRTYGGSNHDLGYYVEETSDRGLIVTGRTLSFGSGTQLYVIKTDSLGNIVWERTYGGPLNEQGRHIKQISDGGYIISGFTTSFGPGDFDAYFIRIDRYGNIMWERAYDRSQLPYPYGDFGQCAVETPDGGFMMAAVTSGATSDRDYWLIRTDGNGDTLWTKVYGGIGEEECKTVEMTSDGNYIIAGRSQSFGFGREDFWLLKTDPNGDTLWSASYGGFHNDFGYWGEQTSDDGYILGGRSLSFGNGDNDYWVVKADDQGALKWSQRYGGPGEDFAFKVRETTDGGYIIGGYSNSFGAGEDDFYLVKIGHQIIRIGVIPQNPPVVVPRGCSVVYSGTLLNNTQNNQQYYVWAKMRRPNGTYFNFGNKSRITNGPNQLLQYSPLTFQIPGDAPLGTYTFIAYCGFTYPNIIDSATFDFSIVDMLCSPTGAEDWRFQAWDECPASDEQIPGATAMAENYPNPFNVSTEIRYLVPAAAQATIDIYNILGQRVETLINSFQEAGWHSTQWDASARSSGLYYFVLKTQDQSVVRKMVVLK